MLKIKVENMASSRGNTVPNQFIIKTDKGDYFQSYNTIIALLESSCDDGLTYKTILDTNALNYSKTTSKYLYEFLGMNNSH